MELYPCRWDVERLFYDLKEVLNLHCFYAANPNAVAMQLYAAGMVYTAMRVAQAHVAQQAGIVPETISTEKFSPEWPLPQANGICCELAVRLSKMPIPERNSGNPPGAG